MTARVVDWYAIFASILGMPVGSVAILGNEKFWLILLSILGKKREILQCSVAIYRQMTSTAIIARFLQYNFQNNWEWEFYFAYLLCAQLDLAISIISSHTNPSVLDLEITLNILSQHLFVMCS